MKSEQEIKDRILELANSSETSLSNVIGALMLLWVLDTDPSKLMSYTDHLASAMEEIASYVESINNITESQ